MNKIAITAFIPILVLIGVPFAVAQSDDWTLTVYVNIPANTGNIRVDLWGSHSSHYWQTIDDTLVNRGVQFNVHVSDIGAGDGYNVCIDTSAGSSCYPYTHQDQTNEYRSLSLSSATTSPATNYDYHPGVEMKILFLNFQNPPTIHH
jgi:hypothetical protein